MHDDAIQRGTARAMTHSPNLPVGPTIDPRPAKRPERVVLHGRLVDLVPLDPLSHGESLFQLTCGTDNEYLWTYLLKGPFTDRKEFDAYLRQQAASKDPMFFVVVEKRSARAVGWASYMRIEPENRVIEVGHVMFSPELRRTTGATEAIYLMARNAFEALGYRRFEWKCNALNAASRRAALRFGFTFEGIFRQHMIVKGRSRDTAWFSMLDHEWPRVRAGFERWLAPENFDAAGRQRTPLA